MLAAAGLEEHFDGFCDTEKLIFEFSYGQDMACGRRSVGVTRCANVAAAPALCGRVCGGILPRDR
jgi:hypothetical protein